MTEISGEISCVLYHSYRSCSCPRSSAGSCENSVTFPNRMQPSFFSNNSFEFGDKTRKITLPDSDDPSDIGHTVKITNKADSELFIRSSGKNWKLRPGAAVVFNYDGSSWTKKGAAASKKACPPPPDHGSCSSSSSSDDDCGKRGPRGPRGFPGRDGCPGANGLNGLNGKPGRCECRSSQSVIVQYSGTAATYNTTVQVPCWAKSTLVTAVGGGGSGGAAIATAEVIRGGSGGGSGFSVTQPIQTAGGFLQLSIGQGGQGAVAGNGNATSVSYLGSLPWLVSAPGGYAGGSAVPVANPAVSDGFYAGGGGDGNTAPSPAGSAVIPGQQATSGVKGGNGAGPTAGVGGTDLVASLIYGGGGGGSAPGPILGPGGNGGGSVPAAPGIQLNGLNGTYGAGGGGAAGQGGVAPVVGVPGNGGNGYVIVTFSA